MSQWGQTRSFVTTDGYIRVLAHVAGPTWHPLHLDHKIDDLIVMDITGSEELGLTKLAELKREWIGKTHREWTNVRS